MGFFCGVLIAHVVTAFQLGEKRVKARPRHSDRLSPSLQLERDVEIHTGARWVPSN